MKMKTMTVKATMQTDLTGNLNVPEHWTEEDVHEWLRSGDSSCFAGGMREDGWGDWTWYSVDEAKTFDPDGDTILEEELA